MTDPSDGASERIAVRPLDPDEAGFLRAVATHLNMHRSCTFKVCRRARACATRHVVCYQATQEHLRPIARSIMARLWVKAVARGAEIDIPPAREDDMNRLLAYEDREMAKIVAGEYGDEDQLTPYRLWLKRLARDEARRPPAPTSSTLP
jgi:hypothetical protein